MSLRESVSVAPLTNDTFPSVLRTCISAASHVAESRVLCEARAVPMKEDAGICVHVHVRVTVTHAPEVRPSFCFFF